MFSKHRAHPKLLIYSSLRFIWAIFELNLLKFQKMAKLSRFGPYKYYVYALYIFKAEKRQISLFQKKLSDFNFFYIKMTVASRAIGPWGAQPRPRPLSAAAAEKRRQFERFSKCFDFHNSNAKITLEIRGTNVGCLRPQNWPLMTSNDL